MNSPMTCRNGETWESVDEGWGTGPLILPQCRSQTKRASVKQRWLQHYILQINLRCWQMSEKLSIHLALPHSTKHNLKLLQMFVSLREVKKVTKYYSKCKIKLYTTSWGDRIHDNMCSMLSMQGYIFFRQPEISLHCIHVLQRRCQDKWHS